MPHTETLPLLLKQLRLPTMQRRWQSQHKHALQDNWSMPQYLSVLCEEELAQRENLRLQRYLKEAKLPMGKTLEKFDFNACQVHQAEISHLAHDGQWLENAENLLLFGPSGTGKTHLAAALATLRCSGGSVCCSAQRQLSSSTYSRPNDNYNCHRHSLNSTSTHC